MKRIMIILSFILTMFLTMCNCSLITSQSSQGNVKVDIAWKAPVDTIANFSILIHGNTAYIPVIEGLTAVNLDNGSIKWKVEGVFVPNSNPVIISNYLYIFEFYDSDSVIITNVRIAKISLDGSSVEMMNVGPDITWKTRMFKLSSDETFLYWGARSFNVGEGTNKLVKLNPATMEKSIIYTSIDEFFCKILIDNSILYAGTFPQDEAGRVNPGTIIVINLSNNNILWKKSPKFAYYLDAFPLVIKDDRLYVFDSRSTACYNQNTGQEIFDNSNSFGGYYGGGVFDGNYAYFTSPRINMPKVYCINKNTGAVIWSANNEQLGSTPHINKGILYVAGPNQLCLYNATNGTLIGTDPRIKGQMFQMSPTERYGDLMIICGSEGMVAVRMNYKL